MPAVQFPLNDGLPKVVGSFGDSSDLQKIGLKEVTEACDIAEIRLDLLLAGQPEMHGQAWSFLLDFPLLFTARRFEEGGSLPLDADQRANLLTKALDQATAVDVEVASISEMTGLLEQLKEREIIWVASYHDFEKLPPTRQLEEAAEKARNAGATLFKAAARLHSPADLARLAEFQLADHGLPVSTMGMGPLAPVSRLLCAQCGSVLNYGYLGENPTAPGQWDSALLKQAISRLIAIRI
jgi:3-dehydroquinate dehydratase I